MFRIFNHYVPIEGVVLLVAEVLCLIASVYLGAAVRFSEPVQDITRTYTDLRQEAGVFAVVMVLSMTAFGMYHLNNREKFRDTLLRLMPALAVGFALMTLVFYLYPDLYFGRGILGIVMVISAAGIFLTRALYYKCSRLSLRETPVMILGVGRLARECTTLFEQNSGANKFKIVGFIALGEEDPQVMEGSILPRKGSLMSMAKKFNVKEIIVAVQNRRGGGLPIQELLECKLNGIKVIDVATFFEREANQVRVDSLQPSWLVFGGGFDQGDFRVMVKKAFDVLASLILLVVTLPVMLITALFIYIEDRTPIFYRQERVGLDGHTFMVLKFRSMRNDAEKFGEPKWASADDPRTTKVGRFIRKLRIDELPQILNVLKGEMSFVGPRPERPFFVKKLCEEIPYYNVRHSIKPGITGWAQVRYAYGASVEDAIQKLQYDLYYVKNNSLFLDLMILVDTVQVVLLGKGGR